MPAIQSLTQYTLLGLILSLHPNMFELIILPTSQIYTAESYTNQKLHGSVISIYDSLAFRFWIQDYISWKTLAKMLYLCIIA